MSAPFAPDRSQIERFANVLFRCVEPGTYVRLCAFDQFDTKAAPLFNYGIPLNRDLKDLVDQAFAVVAAIAERAPSVFAPPICTFRGAGRFRTDDLAHGLTLSVEIDSGDTAAARRKLEQLLGPATMIVASGSDYVEPETGTVHPKLHIHWRLSEMTTALAEHDKLYQLRDLAVRLVGADPTGKPIVHPLRWPGSWNRKATPRMAQIVSENAGAEINLDEAHEALVEAVEAAGMAAVGLSRSGTLQAPVQVLTSAMAAIPNPGAEVHYHDWMRYGYALHRATGGSDIGRDIWDEWSRKSEKYDAGEQDAAWNRICHAMNGSDPPRKIGAGSIFYDAARAGWSRPLPEPPAEETDPNYWLSVEAESVAQSRRTAPAAQLDAQAFSRTADRNDGPMRGHEGKSELWIDQDEWDEAELPMRPWVVQGYLLRGAVTLLSGPPSAMKSSIALCWATAVTLGSTFGRFTATTPQRIIVYNVEDDATEQRRRLSAALRQFGATPRDIRGKLIRTGPLGIGTLLTYDDARFVRFTPAMERLEALIDEVKPAALILDPLAELHTAEENDNTALRAIVARFREMAITHGIAIVLLHHTRKGGSASPGDPDIARGASAIIGASRIALTLVGMSEDDAKKFGLPHDTLSRSFYVRLDDAKQNYAPIRDAEWFEKCPYELKSNEIVPAPVPWTPPPARSPTQADVSKFVTDIERGAPCGEPWSPKLSSDARSIRCLMRKYGFTGNEIENSVLERLKAECGVQVATYKRPTRTLAQGLRVGDKPAAKWIETPKEDS